MAIVTPTAPTNATASAIHPQGVESSPLDDAAVGVTGTADGEGVWLAAGDAMTVATMTAVCDGTTAGCDDGVTTTTAAGGCCVAVAGGLGVGLGVGRACVGRGVGAGATVGVAGAAGLCADERVGKAIGCDASALRDGRPLRAGSAFDPPPPPQAASRTAIDSGTTTHAASPFMTARARAEPIGQPSVVRCRLRRSADYVVASAASASTTADASAFSACRLIFS